MFVRSDNTVILEVKWDNDADGTLTAMFSENDTEQMVFTLVMIIIDKKITPLPCSKCRTLF